MQKTTWNLDLLYTSAADPHIEKDIKTFEKAVIQFEKKYKDLKFLNSESALIKALTDFEMLSGMPESARAIIYFHYRTDLNATDEEAQAKLNVISQRLTVSGNKLVFFDIALGKIPKEKQKVYLQSKKLSHFKYFLERAFITARYNLSEPEEKILNLKSLPSHRLWVQNQEKLLNQQMVMFKGKEISLPEAMNKLSELGIEERRTLNDAVGEVLKKISYFAESELTAIYLNKKINDELRGLKNSYSATIIGYQNDEKSILNLVDTVTKHFTISQRFYKVKAKMLKVDKLEYADRVAKAGEISIKPSFEESIGILQSAFGKVNPRYREILDSYLERGQIDAFPKQGKRGGAYCSSSTGLPTFVFLNHADNLHSLKTFAHEMGHAIHAEFSKEQPPLYDGHTISVAEVASTLFENFAFEEIFPRLSDAEKIIALHDKINDAISTIFRQIACFNFEKELHDVVRTTGALTKEQIAELHNKHMKAYLGPLFTMKETDGYFFVQWSHIRRFFYVYSYAYGELISKALYNNYKKDPSYITKIEEFLRAGGSKSPEQIFKSIGIDTSKPAFFEAGLKEIEEDIKRLEKLVK